MGWVVNATPLPLYVFCTRPDCPWVQKISSRPPPGSYPWTVQPVASLIKISKEVNKFSHIGSIIPKDFLKVGL